MRNTIILLIHVVLLFTTPLLLACPEIEPMRETSLVSSKREYSEEKFLTYDDLLEFIEEIELGDLEKYSLDEQEWMVQLLVFLARNGIFPGQHENIDQCFSTDFAQAYTPEAKAALRESITLGILPPPQALNLVHVEL